MPALGVPAWLSTWLQTPLQQTYLSTTHPSEHKDSCPGAPACPDWSQQTLHRQRNDPCGYVAGNLPSNMLAASHTYVPELLDHATILREEVGMHPPIPTNSVSEPGSSSETRRS